MSESDPNKMGLAMEATAKHLQESTREYIERMRTLKPGSKTIAAVRRLAEKDGD